MGCIATHLPHFRTNIYPKSSILPEFLSPDKHLVSEVKLLLFCEGLKFFRSWVRFPSRTHLISKKCDSCVNMHRQTIYHVYRQISEIDHHCWHGRELVLWKHNYQQWGKWCIRDAGKHWLGISVGRGEIAQTRKPDNTANQSDLAPKRLINNANQFAGITKSMHAYYVRFLGCFWINHWNMYLKINKYIAYISYRGIYTGMHVCEWKFINTSH